MWIKCPCGFGNIVKSITETKQIEVKEDITFLPNCTSRGRFTSLVATEKPPIGEESSMILA